MDSLKNNLLNIHGFEQLSRKMLEKEINDLGKNLLKSLNADSFIKHRDFLSAFMVYKFPYDVIGDLNSDLDKEVYQASCKLMENEDYESKELVKLIVKFNFSFKKWRGEDEKTLKQQLFNEYHQLGIDIMNTEDEDRKTVFKLTRDRILDCSHKIGGKEFIEQIFSYKPVVMNVDELVKQYDKAYYDNLSEEFNNNKFEKIEGLFTFIKNTCKQFNREEEHSNIDNYLDIDFIIHRIKNKSYSNEEYRNLFDYMFQIIKNIQSSSKDEILESFIKEMHNEDVYVPKVLMQMVELIKSTIQDLENLKNEFIEKNK